MKKNYLNMLKTRKKEQEISLFQKELIRNEMFRSLILSMAMLISVVFATLVLAVYGKKYAMMGGGIDVVYWTILVLLVLGFRALLIRRYLQTRLTNNKPLVRRFHYFNTLVEVSVPTITMFIYSNHISPVYTLLTPVVSLYYVFILLSVLDLDPWVCVFSGVVAGVEYAGLSLYFLYFVGGEPVPEFFSSDALYLGRAMSFIALGMVAGLIADRIKKYFLELLEQEDERRNIERLFGQQISDKIVEELVKNKQKLVGKLQDVTVMFVDIRGYAAFCSDKTPEQIAGYQNQVFSFMIDAVTRHNGIINQFLGDGIMCTFGAPIHLGTEEDDALAAAIDILDELERQNQSGEIAKTAIGIGIHSGQAFTGNIGTAVRQQYSVSGNMVTGAARIEQLNKELGTSLLISETVFHKIAIHRDQFTSLGEFHLKGMSKPLIVYRWDGKDAQ
mgnify:CR=1 FL=1